MKNLFILTLISLFINCQFAFATDWPTFRNDLQNSGISTETDLLESWPEGGPELLWSIEGKFGIGWSSCAIVDDIVYTAGMDSETRQGILYKISQNGQILWQKPFGPEWIRSFRGSRATPSVVDGKVFIMTGNGLVTCFDAADGKLNWQVDIAKNYGIRVPTFGMSESPLIFDGKVICSVGGEKASMVALSVADGSEVWAAKSFGRNTSYCSAAYIKHKQQDMAVTMLGDIALAVDPADGQVLWTLKYADFEARGAGMGGDNRTNTPLYYNGKLVMSAGYDKGASVVKIADDCRSVELVKYEQKFDNHHHGLVIHDGHLYGSTWNGNDSGNWMCMDIATGELKYDHSWDSAKGAVIAANGYLYCYHEKGKLALVKADPKGFKISGSINITKGTGEHWAHPAISNGKLYVRHGDALMVYKIAK